MPEPLAPSSTDLLFHALSDPTRRGLFETLCRGGETNVAALTKAAGVSQPVVSRHLAILARAGLVAEARIGRQTRITPLPLALLPLTDWAQAQRQFWEARLDLLETLLKRMDQ